MLALALLTILPTAVELQAALGPGLKLCLVPYGLVAGVRSEQEVEWGMVA